MGIQEIDVLKNFQITLDQFYSLVKAQSGNLAAQQYLQLQATALPLDLADTYRYFSYGNLTRNFDVTVAPTPVSGTLSLISQTRLSQEFGYFLATALALIEVKALPPETLDKIEKMQIEIDNIQRRVTTLMQARTVAWQEYCVGTFTELGDITAWKHWASGQATSTELSQLRILQNQKQALIEALRQTQYASPDDQAIATAYSNYISTASRTRYPRYPDYLYQNANEFNPVYFAKLADNDLELFTNNYIMLPNSDLTTIKTSTIGGFSNAYTTASSSSSAITTDWSGGGSAGYGWFKMRADASSHVAIKNDFSTTTTITVGVKSIQAISFDAKPWFDPNLFRNRVILNNRKAFDRYLGEDGTLLYYPTHLVVARGFNLAFHNSQNWQYDYTSKFSASGGGSINVWGVDFGANAKYSKTVVEQKIEKRGQDLILDDGANTLRILGFVVVKNMDFENEILRSYAPLLQSFNAIGL